MGKFYDLVKDVHVLLGGNGLRKLAKAMDEGGGDGNVIVVPQTLNFNPQDAFYVIDEDSYNYLADFLGIDTSSKETQDASWETFLVEKKQIFATYEMHGMKINLPMYISIMPEQGVLVSSSFVIGSAAIFMIYGKEALSV